MAALSLVVPALILGGCDLTGVLSPEEKGEAIAFEASSPLLRDDANDTKVTKAIKTDFAQDDAFSVFGWHNHASDNIVFDGTVVTKGNGGGWSYSPAKQWEWDGTGDYYDFVAVYPSSSSPARMDVAGNLTVATTYDLSTDDFDLLCATMRRKGIEDNLEAVVNLQFSHMLSAVRVVIENDSDATSFSLNSYCFQHLVASGSCRVTLDDEGNADFSWVDTERNASYVRETSPTPSPQISADGIFTGDFDLMIPGALDVASDGGSETEMMPTLVLKYTPEGGTRQTQRILLKDIQDSDGTPITSWERGIKYTYYLALRLDGGVRVKVITTQWETIEAETPGLLI